MPQLNSCAIVGDEALADFRQGLTGDFAFQLLNEGQGQLLVQLPVGVGKSQWLLAILAHALALESPFDLVVVLVPRWDILRELESKLPEGTDYKVLKPRPKERCGELDGDWNTLEQCGCGLLGRVQICKRCPCRRGCFWPKQYGKKLRGVPLIMATQQHLALNPFFISQLRRDTQASRVLVLIDESHLLLKSVERVIRRADLNRFRDAVKSVAQLSDSPPTLHHWLELLDLLNTAGTEDLQQGNWKFPWMFPDWAVRVQAAGRARFGDRFRFLGYELGHLAWSDRRSRERLENGDLRMAVLPYLGDAFIIFSGSIATQLARYRLDPDHRRSHLFSPFRDYRFEHPGTRWYNIGSTEAAAKNFPGNAARILDFFAAKIAQNIESGKRTLLVARKRYLQQCAELLTIRLRELGYANVRVITSNWNSVVFDNPRMLALINYGIMGVNLFEDFDAAYCLTSYYVNPRVLAASVRDIDPEAEHFLITVVQQWNPPRRIAHVEIPHQATILPQIVQGMLEQKEADVVVQAVGRVRPFTRPREIITFQADTLPGVNYRFSFRTLADARQHFGIPTRRTSLRDIRATNAVRLQMEGLPVAEIAKQIGMSDRTVRRYLSSA